MKKLITILLMLFSITAFGQYRYTMAVGEYAISSLGSTTYVTNNTRVVNWPTPIDRATAYKYVASGANLDTLTTTRTKPGFLYVGLEPGGTFTGTLTVADDSVKVGPGAVANVRSGKSGAKPIITGFTAVTEWTDKGGNIWESTNAVSDLATLNMVVVNGVNTPMGRTPNTGYYYYQTQNGALRTITSSDVSGGTDYWKGAQICAQLNRWEISRGEITAQTGTTLTYSASINISATPSGTDRKFIIQNDLRTLDTQNEWYYNPSTKKLSIYSTSIPTNVQVSTIDKLLIVSSKNYVTVNNISFKGSNTDAVSLYTANHATINNCAFENIGEDAIQGERWGSSTNVTVSNCLLNNINNSGITLTHAFENATIRNNTLTNIGMNIGGVALNGLSGNTTESLVGIVVQGENTLTEYNTLANIGYNGINFYKDNSIVRFNYIDNFCSIAADGAAIYTYNGGVGVNDIEHSGMVIYKNIVGNSIDGYGIYLDGQTNGLSLTDNYVYDCEIGIFLNNDSNVVVRNNTLYNNVAGININGSGYSVITADNISIKKNKIVSPLDAQWSIVSDYMNNILLSSFAMDSNYYVKTNNSFMVNLVLYSPSFSNPMYGLEKWKSYSGQDTHSLEPVDPPLAGSYLKIYNATKLPKDTILSETYYDADGTAYSGTATLQPYTGLALFKTGTYADLLTSDIIAYWNLDQSSSTLEDQVGSNDMINTSNHSLVNQTGKINKGVSFVNSYDDLTAPYSESLYPTDSKFSVGAWIKSSSLATAQQIFSHNNGGNIFYFRVNTDGALLGVIVNNASSTFNITTATGLITAGTWYYVTLVLYGADYAPKIFINGVDVTTSSTKFAGTLKSNGGTGTYSIGNSSATNFSSFVGTIDEVGYYNKPISDREIKKLINSGTGITYPFTE